MPQGSILGPLLFLLTLLTLMAVFPYLLGVGLDLLLHSFQSRATSWVTLTHVMSSLICWCHVFLGRPRRLVPGIASSITLRVTLSGHVQTNEDGHRASPRRSVKRVVCVGFLRFARDVVSTLRGSREASSSPW